MEPGDLVLIDADTAEYGRVVGTATIIESEDVGAFKRLLGKGVVLVNAHGIRANIFIQRGELTKI